MINRRTFLAAMGAGSACLALPAFRYSASSPTLKPESLRIDPRLIDKYKAVYGGKPFHKPSQPTRRNILLITSDQHHYMYMGLKNPKVKTPNLDRLAKMGIVFERAYCNNPTSTPTRASIITGLYASQHGAWSLGTKLPETVPTVGAHLQKAGYKTSLIGKAHFQPLGGSEEYPSCEAYPILQDLEFWKNFHGPYYGFDHIELCRNHTDEPHVGQHYAVWMEENGASNWRDWFRKPTGNSAPQHHVWNIPEKYHYNTFISEQTNKRLEKHKERNEPFFLWASYFDPHPSYLVPEPWASMYKPEDMDVPEITPNEFDDKPPHFALTQSRNPDFSYLKEEGEDRPAWVHGAQSQIKTKEEKAKNMATYFGMTSMMDHYIGKVLDKLDELNLTENTTIVFTTDHGHFLGQHGLTAKAIHHYEDLIRIPWIVADPECKAKGSSSHAIQSTVDLAPTFLHLAGLSSSTMAMAGVNQMQVWQGIKDSARNHTLVENHFQPTKFYAKTYVDERYKITIYLNQVYGELFDLHSDPGELKNLWDAPESKQLKADLLLKMLHAEQSKEPLFMPRITVA